MYVRTVQQTRLQKVFFFNVTILYLYSNDPDSVQKLWRSYKMSPFWKISLKCQIWFKSFPLPSKSVSFWHFLSLTSFFIAEKHIFCFLPGEWEIFIKYSVCEYIPYYTVKLYIVQYMSYNKNEYYKHNKTILINILNPTYPGCCAEMMKHF